MNNLAARAAELSHTHHHGAAATSSSERRTKWVVGLTFAMMIGELVVGYATRSMALTADGWHMATHVGALGLASFAYWFARTRATADRFSFGTGKVHALAGYTSAVVLALVAAWMVVESVRRLIHVEPVIFDDALPVAVVGLVVNLVSVKILHGDHGHAHDDHHGHDHHGHDHHGHDHHDDHGHHDHNLRAAYTHVLADALTSVLAILALLGGRYLGWSFLDAAMGIVGGLVIARWSYGLCRSASRQLLDMVPSPSTLGRIRARVEREPESRVVDLHVWDIGPDARACILSVATTQPRSPRAYHELLEHEDFDHLTVEVHTVGDAPRGDSPRG